MTLYLTRTVLGTPPIWLICNKTICVWIVIHESIYLSYNLNCYVPYWISNFSVEKRLRVIEIVSIYSNFHWFVGHQTAKSRPSYSSVAIEWVYVLGPPKALILIAWHKIMTNISSLRALNKRCIYFPLMTQQGSILLLWQYGVDTLTALIQINQ